MTFSGNRPLIFSTSRRRKWRHGLDFSFLQNVLGFEVIADSFVKLPIRPKMVVNGACCWHTSCLKQKSFAKPTLRPEQSTNPPQNFLIGPQ